MIAKEMFSNAISFENAKNVRVNEYNEMLKIQNNIVINKLPKIMMIAESTTVTITKILFACTNTMIN